MEILFNAANPESLDVGQPRTLQVKYNPQTGIPDSAYTEITTPGYYDGAGGVQVLEFTPL